MPTQRRYAFMGPANINSNDRSARRAWLPSRCPMLVMFIVGVSVCVASGFSLFVEYDQRNRCPPPENSIVQKNSPQWQQNHMLENADDGTVFSPADPSSLDSTDAPCEEAKISGTLLVKYLFFLLGLCMSLCTLSCAVILLTQGSPEDPRHHAWCCCFFPRCTAYVNYMRALFGLEPLPEVQSREGQHQGALGGSMAVNHTSSRSGCLWSPREVPVLHGVLVQQPHMRRSSDSGSMESFSKTLHGIVVGVPDSSNSISWSAHLPFKKQAPGTSPLAPRAIAQPDGPSPDRDAADVPATGQLFGSTAEAVAGSSHQSPLAQQHMHAQELAHLEASQGQDQESTSMQDTVLGKGAGMRMYSNKEVHGTVPGSIVATHTQPHTAAPDGHLSVWTHHQNTLAASTSLAGGNLLGMRTPVPIYPDLSSTMSACSTPREHYSGRLDAAAKQDESTISSLMSTATTGSSPEEHKPADKHDSMPGVSNTQHQQPYEPGRSSLNLEQPSASAELSVEPSTEPSMEPSSVQGLASEHTMHDLGVEFSTATESSTGGLAPEPGLQDVSGAASPPEMSDEGSQKGLAELAPRLQVPFEFPARVERPGHRFHELATPRMNDALEAPSRSANSNHSSQPDVCTNGPAGSQRAVDEGTGGVVQQRPYGPQSGQSLPQGFVSETSQESGLHSGPLTESNLTVESSLPEGMSSESALSGGPSGLSVGYSLQSIIGGAVTRFAA